jgi:hypothetical protein
MEEIAFKETRLRKVMDSRGKGKRRRSRGRIGRKEEEE